MKPKLSDEPSSYRQAYSVTTYAGSVSGSVVGITGGVGYIIQSTILATSGATPYIYGASIGTFSTLGAQFTTPHTVKGSAPFWIGSPGAMQYWVLLHLSAGSNNYVSSAQGATTTNYILQENGDRILLEDGSGALLLET